MNDDRPLFVQIASEIENQIVEGALLEESMAPSTNALAAFYRINPATAAKGMRLLQEDGILERRRGLGMFVTKGARKVLLEKRRSAVIQSYVRPLVKEARTIGLNDAELVQIVLREVERTVASGAVDSGVDEDIHEVEPSAAGARAGTTTEATQ